MMRMTGEYVGGFIAGVGFGLMIAGLTVAVSYLSETGSLVSFAWFGSSPSPTALNECPLIHVQFRSMLVTVPLSSIDLFQCQHGKTSVARNDAELHRLVTRL